MSASSLHTTEAKPPHERLYLFDNLKAMLITLVVLGHVFELITSSLLDVAYSFIYMFHMPLFIFCSGYFAKHNPKKILTGIAVPYVLFQLIYILFGRHVLGRGYLIIQFTTPYWILWYLLAMFAWMLVLPVIDYFTDTKRGMIITVCASVLLGLAAGFDSTMGYFMSLSRIFYFFPFFVAGYCVKKAVPPQEFTRFVSKWYVRCVTGVFSTGILVWLFFNNDRIDVRWLWAAFSYASLEHTGYNAGVRLALYLCAVVISLFCLSMIPRGKMFFSYIGTRTLTVFLMHGLVVRLMRAYNVFEHVPGGLFTALFALVVSVVMVLLFSVRGFQKGDKVQ